MDYGVPTPLVRPRRLRQTPVLRDLLQETHLKMTDVIYPIFIEEQIKKPVPISSMPGISRHPESTISNVMQDAWDKGIRAVMLFGVSHKKDASGSDSMSQDGLLARMVSAAKDAVPEMIVMADICFCEYTDHGHCGVLTGDQVDNDATLENLATQALVAAQAGADVVAPSAMMDGQVAAIRFKLDENGFKDTPIMSYSSKMASAFYGPFREAAGCSLKGDRKQYQMNPANAREAMTESAIDEAEGADILMVKPGMAYLDILTKIRMRTNLPVAAYQISGEFAMIKFAAEAGALDEKACALESLLAFKRAGADLILTYFAPQLQAWLEE